MDFVIQSHMKTLFAGKLPENRADFLLQRYMTQFGMSSKILAKDRRTHGIPHKKDIFRPGYEHGPVIPNLKVNDIFQDYFVRDVSKSLEKCLYELEALTYTQRQSRNRNRNQPTPIQMLSHAFACDMNNMERYGEGAEQTLSKWHADRFSPRKRMVRIPVVLDKEEMVFVVVFVADEWSAVVMILVLLNNVMERAIYEILIRNWYTIYPS